ncbi:hypothetical protein F4604DRAFT_1930452 [Suillus subluteus]|nr:hypothetical protein F4604DRAFT_1930452 [Suillus subluteus]
MPHIPGPWFPQSNDHDSHPLYCASMLALLKLWRDMTTLKKMDKTFEITFQTFLSGTPKEVHTIVDNIQYFHECSDQAKREQESHSATHDYSFAAVESGEHIDDVYEDMDLSNSSEGDAEVAMNIAEEFNFFGCSADHPIPASIAPIATEEKIEKCALWQKCIADADSSGIEAPKVSVSASLCVLDAHETIMEDGPSTKLSLESPHHDPLESPVSPLSYLNEEQSMVFTLVAEHIYQHLLGNNPPQLLMMVHG